MLQSSNIFSRGVPTYLKQTWINIHFMKERYYGEVNFFTETIFFRLFFTLLFQFVHFI